MEEYLFQNRGTSGKCLSLGDIAQCTWHECSSSSWDVWKDLIDDLVSFLSVWPKHRNMSAGSCCLKGLVVTSYWVLTWEIKILVFALNLKNTKFNPECKIVIKVFRFYSNQNCGVKKKSTTNKIKYTTFNKRFFFFKQWYKFFSSWSLSNLVFFTPLVTPVALCTQPPWPGLEWKKTSDAISNGNRVQCALHINRALTFPSMEGIINSCVHTQTTHSQH